MSWLEALLFLTVRMAYTPDAEAQTWRDFAGSFARVPGRVLGGLLTVRVWWFWALELLLGAGLWLGTHNLVVTLLAVVLLPVLLGVLSALWGIVLGFLEALTGTLSGITAAGLNVVRDAYARGPRRGAALQSGGAAGGGGLPRPDAGAGDSAYQLPPSHPAPIPARCRHAFACPTVCRSAPTTNSWRGWKPSSFASARYRRCRRRSTAAAAA